MFEHAKDAEDAVAELNLSIHERLGDLADAPFAEFRSNGTHQQVWFMGGIIWDSEEDERNFSDENNKYEDLEAFLRREASARILSVTPLLPND